MCVGVMDIVNFAEFLFIVHTISNFHVQFPCTAMAGMSGIIGSEKVKRTHLSTWRMIFKCFNCVLHSYI